MKTRHVTDRLWTDDVGPAMVVALAQQIPSIETDEMVRLIKANASPRHSPHRS